MNATPCLVAAILVPEDAAPSYPLARLARPRLRLADWRRTVRRAAIVGVRNPAGCFVALLACRGGRLTPIAAPALACRMERVMEAAAKALAAARK